MSSGRMIDYEALAQDAMRGVVRAVLARTAKSGLPGDHHFYISFDTQHPGVVLSKRLREKYPEEMTIVLQHRFWDLSVTEDRFEVKLTFDGIPERLVVPFAALKIFFDPSVRYGLQFEAPDLGPEALEQSQSGLETGAEEEEAMPAPRPQPAPLRGAPRSAVERKPTRSPRKARPDRPSDQPGMTEPSSAHPASSKPAPEAPSKSHSQVQQSADETEAERPPSGGAQIVSLDAFRKK
jgi:hypothetical protein